jgi:uncharacterized protein (DUF885 family)
MSSDGALEVAGLAQELFEVSCSARPLWAAIFGVPGYDEALTDLSEEGEAASAARLRDVASRAEKLDPAALGTADRVTRACMLQEARSLAEQFEDRHTELALSGHASPISALFQVLPKTAPEAVGGLEIRLRGVPTYLAQVSARARSAAANGRAPHARGLQNVIDQITAYLALPLDRDPFLQPAVGTASATPVRRLVADEVRPAMQALLEVLRGPVKDAARSDDRPGLGHVPDGDAIYRRALNAHTTTDRTPEEIHQSGLDLCAQLRDEYARLGQSVFGTSRFEDVVDRLRNDAGLRYGNAEEMMADARAALTRAEQALPQWFGTWHRAACEVEEMSALEAPTAVLGYYMPPASDGSRPGRHWLNTFQPDTRPRYEYETLAYHESVPGHHLQLTVSQELGDDIPAFRRFGYIAAFSEGWGLYTERLCDEMGLYSGDLARFGMASFDSWRACRLVVDTGMHAFGWSRQQAIDFMWENSALTMANIVNEVDRYIAWPGQACAYMIGRLEIDDLRANAKGQMGPTFDMKAFHDAVLLNGSVPLNVQREEVGHALGTS